MKNLLIIACLLAFCYKTQAQAKSGAEPPPTVAHLVLSHPPIIQLKDIIPADTGKYVQLREVVYGHMVLDTLELLALGAPYPDEKLTVIVEGAAFKALKTTDINGKIILVNGEIVFYKGEYQIYVSSPQQIYMIKNKEDE